jgi:heme exporter protein D
MLITVILALTGDVSRLLTRPLTRLYGGALMVLPRPVTFGRLPTGYCGLKTSGSGFGYVLPTAAVESVLGPGAGPFFYLEDCYTDTGVRLPVLARRAAPGDDGLRVTGGRSFAPGDGLVLMVNSSHGAAYPVGSQVRLFIPRLHVNGAGQLLLDFAHAGALDFTVIGHYRSPIALPGPMFLMELDTFRTATGVPGGWAMGVVGADGSEAATVCARELLPELRVMGAADLTMSVFTGARLRDETSAAVAVSGFYVWAVVATSFLVMANTHLVVLRQRRLEFAVLRALGWRPRQLAALLCWESFTIGAIGGVTGYALACVLIQSAVARYGGSIADLPGLSALHALMVSGGAGLVSLVTGLQPARAAARTGPAEVIRGA